MQRRKQLIRNVPAGVKHCCVPLQPGSSKKREERRETEGEKERDVKKGAICWLFCQNITSRCLESFETNLAVALIAPDRCLPRFWQRHTVIQITNNTPPSTFYPTPGDKLPATRDGLARNYPHQIHRAV